MTIPLLDLTPEGLANSARRIMARCNELARISSLRGGVERVYLSPEHARANRLAAEWMRDVGLTTHQDAAGNQVGRIAGRDPEAPALMLGSHLDTVPDAGRFDGILGVLMAIEVIRLLRARIPTFPFCLEVIAFSDEEGTRFGKALLGSAAVAGSWDPAWWELTDAHGTTVRQAFLEFGLDPSRVGEAARRPDELVGYLEAHIEQGPQLDRAGQPLAVVSSIASARRFQITIRGEARHAGGTPYDMRHDALLGASELAIAVERLCLAEHHLIGTVGQLSAYPGAVNVVPGEARLSLDLRGELEGTRDRVWTALTQELDQIAGRRGLRWEAREVHTASAVVCEPLLMDVVRAGIEGSGQADPMSLFSPAGHDGMAIGRIADIGMLFLRNPDGISHHPDEYVSTEDIAVGLRAFAEAIVHLAREHANS